MTKDKSGIFVPANSTNQFEKKVAFEEKPILPLNASFREGRKKSKCINPRLIPVKLLVFLIHGGNSATFAFGTVHMKSLGIGVTDMALVLLLIPILSSIGPTISGALADRIGNYKIVLITFTLLTAIFSTCLWFFVPSFGMLAVPAQLPLNSSQRVSFTTELPCFYEHLPEESAEKKWEKNNFLDVRGDWQAELLIGKNFSESSCSTQCSSSVLTTEPNICFFVPTNSSRVGFDFDFPLCESRQECVKECAKSSQFLKLPVVNNALAMFDGGLQNLPNDPPTKLFCEVQRGHIFPANTTNIRLPSCTVKCNNFINSTNNTQELSSSGVPFGNKAMTISLYFIFRFLSFTSSRGIFPLLDAAVLQVAKQEGGDFGIQRLFASVGCVVVPPLSGWLTMLASQSCGCSDFSPAFYLFGGMTILGAILIYFMDIRVKQPQTQILKTIGIVMRDPNVVAFLIVVFCSGSAWGFANGYLFLFMEDDKDFIFSSSTGILGLVNAAGWAAGIPFSYFSTQLIRRFGHEHLVALVVFCYSARFLIYSFTYNPYFIFPTEILTGVTFLVFILGPQFAMKKAPKYLATLVGLFGAANFGIGGGIGPLIGGFLIHWFGFRPTFRILSASMAVVGSVYLLVYHLYLKKLTIPSDAPKLKVHKEIKPNGEEAQPLTLLNERTPQIIKELDQKQ